MNRREFFRLGAAAIAGLAIDPEELLWVPSRSRIFVPGIARLSTSQIVAAEMERILPHVRTLFQRDDLFYRSLGRAPVVSSREIRIPLIIEPGAKHEV